MKSYLQLDMISIFINSIEIKQLFEIRQKQFFKQIFNVSKT